MTKSRTAKKKWEIQYKGNEEYSTNSWVSLDFEKKVILMNKAGHKLIHDLVEMNQLDKFIDEVERLYYKKQEH